MATLLFFFLGQQRTQQTHFRFLTVTRFLLRAACTNQPQTLTARGLEEHTLGETPPLPVWWRAPLISTPAFGLSSALARILALAVRCCVGGRAASWDWQVRLVGAAPALISAASPACEKWGGSPALQLKLSRFYGAHGILLTFWITWQATRAVRQGRRLLALISAGRTKEVFLCGKMYFFQISREFFYIQCSQSENYGFWSVSPMLMHKS